MTTAPFDVEALGCGGVPLEMSMSRTRRALPPHLKDAYVQDAYVPDFDAAEPSPAGPVAQPREQILLVDCRNHMAPLTSGDTVQASTATSTLTGAAVRFSRSWSSRLPPGLPTSGLESSTRRLLGMHVDNQEITCNERPGDCRRICVNVGRGDRQFLFLPWSLRSLFDEAGEPFDPVNANDVVRAFLNSSAKIPIASLRVPPGFGYICATDEVVHDGMTSRSEWDETVTWFGAITRRRSA